MGQENRTYTLNTIASLEKRNFLIVDRVVGKTKINPNSSYRKQIPISKSNLKENDKKAKRKEQLRIAQQKRRDTLKANAKRKKEYYRKP